MKSLALSTTRTYGLSPIRDATLGILDESESDFDAARGSRSLAACVELATLPLDLDYMNGYGALRESAAWIPEHSLAGSHIALGRC